MKHLGTKEFETERLLLRRFIIDDAENMFKNWANDDEVTKYLTWESHKSINWSKNILEPWIQNYSKNDFYLRAIVLKEINQPIGSIGIVQQADNTKMVHVGYCLGKKWWNKGITSEAFNVLIKFFFEEVGVNRIESRHDPNNPNSGKVMMKCGLKYEGLRRQADYNNQGICDSAGYGILAEDYFKK
jgi:ribosomal-protein-alanine N-acetyltransferase